MSDRVNFDIKDNVAEVRLNRAEKHNALDHKMFEAIIRIGDQIAHDDSIRAVILHGAGESFCAGIDLSMFAGEGMASDFLKRMKRREGSLANYYQSAAYIWREIPVPVIAVLQGAVYGGGLQIALGADIRYAAEDIKLSIMEIKWGIIPDMALTTSLPYLMSADKAIELAVTADIFNASQALDKGLITAIKGRPLKQARALAKGIANRSPDAIRSIKRLFYETWHKNDEVSLALEAKLQMQVMAGENQMEAVKSSLSKTKPNFSNSKL